MFYLQLSNGNAVFEISREDLLSFFRSGESGKTMADLIRDNGFDIDDVRLNIIDKEPEANGTQNADQQSEPKNETEDRRGIRFNQQVAQAWMAEAEAPWNVEKD